MPPQRVTAYYERVVAQVRAEQQVSIRDSTCCSHIIVHSTSRLPIDLAVTLADDCLKRCIDVS
jgi:hypothetical protein